MTVSPTVNSNRINSSQEDAHVLPSWLTKTDDTENRFRTTDSRKRLVPNDKTQGPAKKSKPLLGNAPPISVC